MGRIERKGLMWAHSLRALVDADGNHFMDDNCESLVKWPSWEGEHIHLVDMNCYVLRRDIAFTMAPIFHRRFRDETSPDFTLCQLLLQHAPRFECSGAYSVNYTVGNSRLSTQKGFFETGNAKMKKRYPNSFPWVSAE